MKSLIFHCEEDAHRVASWLYNCEVKGNAIIFKQKDDAAVQTALGLETIHWEDYLVEGAACLIPFPVNERQCYNDSIPQIYVACLSAYNNGILHGMWIDATYEPDEIQDDINWMLSWSPCGSYDAYVREASRSEEWAIHDHMNFDSIYLGEWESLEKISALAQAIDKHGEAMAAYLGWKSYDEYDVDSLVDDFESCYCGHFDNEKDFALTSDEIEQMYDWDGFEKQFKFWSNCIDWEHVATELFTQGYTSIKANLYGVYVFREE